jgi:hypothetical protein
MTSLAEQILGEEADSEFTRQDSRVELELSGSPLPGQPVESHDKQVAVKFKLETEYRSWGLKEITITPVGEVHFNIEVQGANANEAHLPPEQQLGGEMETHPVQVDISRVRTVFERNDGLVSPQVYLKELSLVFNAKGEHQPERSRLVVAF